MEMGDGVDLQLVVCDADGYHGLMARSRASVRS